MSKSNWTCVLLCASLFAGTVGAGAPEPLRLIDPGSPFEQPLERLEPKEEPSEADKDRILARTLYAHGRMLLQRGELHEALRRFQRAWRYDPHTVSIVEEIVPVALSLQRNDEAARYAVLAAEEITEPQLLLGLGMHLSQQEEVEPALRLYQRAVQADDDQLPLLTRLVIQMEMGRLYFIDERYDQAADAFAEVLEVLDEPDQGQLAGAVRQQILRNPQQTFAVMAESYLEAGRLDQAEQLFERAFAEDEHRAQLDFHRARIANRRGDVQAALAHLDKALESEISDAAAEPYALLEELLRQKHEDQQQATTALLERLTSLWEDDTENVMLGYFLAQQQQQAGQLDEAQELFEQLLEQQPAIEAFQGLAAIYRSQQDDQRLLELLAQVARTAGSLDPLEDELEQLKAETQRIDALLDLADEMRREQESLEDGLPLAAAHLALVRERFELFEAMVDLALQQETPQPSRAVIELGMELFEAEQFERAANIFQRAIDEQLAADLNAAFHFYLAGALELSDQTEKAIEAARKVMELEPDMPQFATRLGWIYFHAGEYDKAEKEYVRVIDKFDTVYDSPDVRRVLRQSRLILSHLCVRQDRMADAEEWLEQVLDEFPEDANALNDLGYLWADQGKRLERSLQMTKKAVEAEPDNAAYLDSLGWALYRLGRYDEAVRELEKAVEADGDEPDGVILDHLGDAYLAVDKKDKALEAWRQAVDAFERQEDSEMLEKTRDKIEQHDPK